MQKLVRVRILGREYPLRILEAQEEEIRAVADGVDARLRGFKRAYPGQSDIVAAVMTALDLADELHTARKVPQRLKEAFDAELKRMDYDLERALQTAEEVG